MSASHKWVKRWLIIDYTNRTTLYSILWRLWYDFERLCLWRRSLKPIRHHWRSCHCVCDSVYIWNKMRLMFVKQSEVVEWSSLKRRGIRSIGAKELCRRWESWKSSLCRCRISRLDWAPHRRASVRSSKHLSRRRGHCCRGSVWRISSSQSTRLWSQKMRSERRYWSLSAGIGPNGRTPDSPTD